MLFIALIVSIHVGPQKKTLVSISCFQGFIFLETLNNLVISILDIKNIHFYFSAAFI